ncbi:MAG: NAD-binding protein [Deltaproteobacteria bacterium]|jgi:Trk K+ transport system NAD-binding subunit|nr:NAD-binding protein [Deltaproteobacteria bacterium]
MRFLSEQVTIFLANRSNKRNMHFMMRFAILMLLLITVYSLLFHAIMHYEGRDHSTITGLYWTLTVMSTLGFGDITFNSDLGRIFTLVVLFSGIMFFLVMLPFIFTRLIYQPWLEAKNRNKVPVALPEAMRDHVLVVGTDDIARTIQTRLRQFSVPSFLLTSDQGEAEALFDQGVPVLRGELDVADTYQAAGAQRASMVVALCDDLKNTNIAATVHEIAPETLLVSSAKNENSMDILHYAGCRHVLHFTNMLGAAIGRRAFAGRAESNIIARFDELCIAEVPSDCTNLVGKSLLELNLRAGHGLNVVGAWQGGNFSGTRADMVIGHGSVLLLSGTAEKLAQFGKECILHPQQEEDSTVLVLGGGKVGQQLVATLTKRGLPFRLVDKNPKMLPEDDHRYILGDAEDSAVLRKAGLDKVNSVAITTHDDDLNIYLTLYCRKLRPEAQIISRCNLSRNIKSLYGAGASLVMAISSLAANSVVNLLSPGSVYLLTEGTNIFRITMPHGLVGKTPRDSGIRDTQCNALGLRRDGKMLVNLDPDNAFAEGDELVLVGSTEAEKNFRAKFLQQQSN